MKLVNSKEFGDLINSAKNKLVCKAKCYKQNECPKYGSEKEPEGPFQIEKSNFMLRILVLNLLKRFQPIRNFELIFYKDAHW